MSAPYHAFPTANGWITVGAANQANWLRLVEVIEAPELLKDTRFSENSDRMSNLDELTEVLGTYFRRRGSGEDCRLEKKRSNGVTYDGRAKQIQRRRDL
jgi:crotonobetainyl-CoA:carnitine CoA-transferase CaiB-like acyl-CoA transferase